MTKEIAKMKRRYFSLPGAFVGFAALLYGPSAALAQVAPPLGVVQQFSVLGGSGVTGSAGVGTLVVGDVGSFPTCNVTNFPPSTVFPPFLLHGPVVCDGTVATARGDATAAFVALNQGVGTVLPANLSLANGTGIITTGIYTFLTGAAILPAGTTVTFSGPGIFVLRTASTLTTVGTSNMLFAGGANPCNVFWQVGSSAIIDSVTFLGQVFASASVTVTGNMTGRAIAGTGAVTMPVGGNTIGGCASAGPPPPSPTPTPGPTPTPVPALPDGAGLILLAVILGSGAYILGRR